jgi:hypothetical protein
MPDHALATIASYPKLGNIGKPLNVLTIGRISKNVFNVNERTILSDKDAYEYFVGSATMPPDLEENLLSACTDFGQAHSNPIRRAYHVLSPALPERHCNSRSDELSHALDHWLGAVDRSCNCGDTQGKRRGADTF